jgi:integrase
MKKLKGIKGRALGPDQAQAWNMARKLNAELLALPLGTKAPGCVGWVFDKFFEGEKFQKLAHSTQVDYRWLAKRICKVQVDHRTLGEINAMSIKPHNADWIIDQIREESGHSVSHYCARFARRVWKWAGRKEYVPALNPFKDMELEGLGQREATWTPEQVATVIAKAYEPGQKTSLGLAAHIAYGFAHRKGDILTLTWTALDIGSRKTRKTGVTLPMVASSYPDLDAAIEAERARQKASDKPSTHVIVCESTGRPWHPDTFTHHFRDLMDAAGLPKDLQFRDLRPTAVTELKDAGADIIDMSTHTGHKTVTMARRYARPTAEQFQRAAAKRQANKAKLKDESATGDAEKAVSE